MRKIPLGNDLRDLKTILSKVTGYDDLLETALPSLLWLISLPRRCDRETQVPVGIVNSSWGGSSVEAWMSEEALQKFPRQLHERDLFNSDEYRELCNRSGQMMNRFWDTALYKGDRGLQRRICWNRPELDDTDWQTVDMFSKEWGRKNGYPVSGSHWFRQKVNVSAEQAGKEAVLRLGCMVDADLAVSQNGISVGNTSISIRRVFIGCRLILKPGENLVTVRPINYGGVSQFVPDKPYCLAWGCRYSPFVQPLKYQLGCEMPARNSIKIFQNVPTGMYNSSDFSPGNLAFNSKGGIRENGNTGPNEGEELLAATDY